MYEVIPASHLFFILFLLLSGLDLKYVFLSQCGIASRGFKGDILISVLSSFLLHIYSVLVLLTGIEADNESPYSIQFHCLQAKSICSILVYVYICSKKTRSPHILVSRRHNLQRRGFLAPLASSPCHLL